MATVRDEKRPRDLTSPGAMASPYAEGTSTMNATLSTPAVTLGYRFAAVPEWVIYHPTLSDKAVRLYAALARHGSSPEDCYPSHSRLADLVGCNERSVQRPLRELADAGAVSIVPRWDSAGKQTSNGYLLAGDMPLTFTRAGERGRAMVRDDDGGGPAQENAGRGARESAPKENQLKEITTKGFSRTSNGHAQESAPGTARRNGEPDPVALYARADEHRLELAAEPDWDRNVNAAKAARAALAAKRSEQTPPTREDPDHA